jgi:hypothetical protein
LRIVSTGAVRAHGEDRDLAAGGLLDLQGLLDGVLVDLVHDDVDRRAVEGLVTVLELALGPGVGHLLDQYDDVHVGRRPPSRGVAGGRAGASGGPAR